MTDSEAQPTPGGKRLRPHRGIVFKCCNVYARVYLNARGDAFVGWCPRCIARLELQIRPDGSDARFFEAE